MVDDCHIQSFGKIHSSRKIGAPTDAKIHFLEATEATGVSGAFWNDSGRQVGASQGGHCPNPCGDWKMSNNNRPKND